jgi:hypothetical protein
MNPLVYLRKELGFRLGEFTELPETYKTWYRDAALEEMTVCGLATK